MPVKRVLHILPHRGGGGEVYVSTLSSAPGFTHSTFYLSAGRTPSSAVASVPAVLPALITQALAADILHVHGDAAAVITAPILPLRPSVLTLHGLHLLRRSTGIRLRSVRLGLRAAVAASRAVIACSESEITDLLPAVRAADRSKLRVIFSGVQTASSPSEEERQRTRAALEVDSGTVLGLFAGELESRKEPLLAAAAARRVRVAGIPFQLVIAGGGPLSEALEAMSDDAIRPLGFRSDVPQLMSAADLFVQTSSREGMSLAVLEAMSHGLPIVASDVPANAEAVADTGLLFSAGDEAGLTHALVRLANEPELRARLGTEARHRATQQFGIDRFLTENAAVYESLASTER